MFVNQERSPVQNIPSGCAGKENRTNATLAEESIGEIPDNIASNVDIRGEAEIANDAVKNMYIETAEKVLSVYCTNS